MPLLVSVRSAEEVSAALAGGADIIDAKEPARGSLGAVDPEVLSAIAAGTPGSVPLSVALGDCATEEEVRCAVSAVRLPKRSAPVYLKLGFAGIASADRVVGLLRAAVATATASELDLDIVGVAYGDNRAAGKRPPASKCAPRGRAARRGGRSCGRTADRYLPEGWTQAARSPPPRPTLRPLRERSYRRPPLRCRGQPRSRCDLPPRADRGRPWRSRGGVSWGQDRHGDLRARR